MKKILGTIRMVDLQRLQLLGPMNIGILESAVQAAVKMIAPQATETTVWISQRDGGVKVEVDLPDGDPLLNAPPMMITVDSPPGVA